MQKRERSRNKEYILLAIFLFVGFFGFGIAHGIGNDKNKVVGYYKYNNNTRLEVYLKNISEKESLVFLQNYHVLWKVYLKKTPVEMPKCERYVIGGGDVLFKDEQLIRCKDSFSWFQLRDFLLLFKRDIFLDDHDKVYNYANRWMLDPIYIKENISDDYYKVNDDGSIDISLIIYFKPQIYFNILSLISLTAFLLTLSFLLSGYFKRTL